MGSVASFHLALKVDTQLVKSLIRFASIDYLNYLEGLAGGGKGWAGSI